MHIKEIIVKEGMSKIVDMKLRLLKIIILQIWTVCGASNDRLPKILEMPQDFIYAVSRYDPISFHCVLSPFDARLLLLVRYSHQSKFGFHTLYNSSKDLSGISSPSIEPLMVTVSFNIKKKQNLQYLNVTLSNWIRLLSQPIHLNVASSSGAILSPPIKIQLYHLSKFKERGDEYVEFVMGNVGQIACEVPHSKPYPPTIRFQHHSSVINVTDDSRYMVVEFPPLFDRVSLLIRNIMFEDSGIYKCVSYLENTKFQYISEKKTHLIVKVPKQNIPTRFRLSSHSSLDDSNKIDIKVAEGSKLVLYCIYESAPILEVNWYWPRSDQQYQINQHFGMLTISNVTVRDNSDVSCLINEGTGKIFHIQVYKLPQIMVTPPLLEINDHTFNKSVTMNCSGNLKNIQDQTIHWIFNGDLANSLENILVKNAVMVIKRLTWQHLGMYQCIIEVDNRWLSATSVIQLNQEKISKNPTKSKKTLQINSGSSINLRCKIPIDFDTRNTLAQWQKKRGRKLISMNNEKYLMYLDGEHNEHVLTIRQTAEGQDNGTYICKIITNDTQDLLVETHFKVTFNKVNHPNQPPNNDNTVSPSGPMFQITKPIILMPKRFLLAVNITWKLSTNLQIFNESNIINHYRVEVREGLPKYRPVRWRSSQPIIQWNNSILVDKFYSDSSCIIHNSNIFKPQYWYSFRALGIPDIKYLQVQLSSTPKLLINDFYHQIRSPWSDSINFEHILPQKPKIINVTALNSTQVRLKWSYSPISDIRRYQSKQSIEFKVLYIVIPASLLNEQSKESYNQWFDFLYESQLQNDEGNDDNIRIATKVSSYKSTVHQMELTSLQKNTHYMVTLYGIIRPIYGGAKMYTPLSDASFVDTKWKPEEIGNFNKRFDQSRHNETNSTSSYFRNKILFLILGSLAGILFVIALSMFIMCVWYQIMYHSRKRQNISLASSAKTSSANTFPPIGSPGQVANNSLFVTSSNIVSPQNLSLWYKNNRDPSELSHLYLAQHFSLWSPNHLAQFNLPNNLHDQIIDEAKSKKASDSPTTLSTPSPKSNIDIEINNLDGSIEDSQEESVRLLDYQTHSSSFRREQQCTLNNAFSVQSEGRERKDQESMSDYARSISHYPFSPSALDIYSQKKRPKMCSTSRKDFSSIKINLKQCKFQNANYFLPIRTRLSCFFPSAPKTDSPTPCSPVSPSFCRDNSVNHYNRLKKDDTFAEHPFPSAADYLSKNCLTNVRESSTKQLTHYSSMKAPTTQKLSSKFLFDPIVDLNIHDDTHSNSTAASARHFSFSMYPDGVRPCINIDLDQNNQTNL